MKIGLILCQSKKFLRTPTIQIKHYWILEHNSLLFFFFQFYKLSIHNFPKQYKMINNFGLIISCTQPNYETMQKLQIKHKKYLKKICTGE